MTTYRMRPLLAIAFLAASTGSVCVAAATERSREFLDGLRRRGYYDHALEYLESLESNRLAPADFKQTLLYEEALTLLESAHSVGDFSIKQRQLDQAHDKFQKFRAAHPQHGLAETARTHMADVLVERARTLVARSQSPRAPDKQQLRQEARGIFDQAGKVFAEAMAQAEERLKKYPRQIPESDKKLKDEQAQDRGDWAQARLLGGIVLYEKTKTAEPASSEQEEMLKAAALELAKIHSELPTWLAGLYARMYEGRCYQDLGERKDALAAFEDVLKTSGEEFRELKLQALRHAVEIWNHEKQYDEAISRAADWVNQNREGGGLGSDPDWLVLKYQLAVSYQKQAAQLKGDPQAKKHIHEARLLAQELSKTPGEQQEQAQVLLAQLGGRPANDKDKMTSGKSTGKVNERQADKAGEKAPTTFLEAMDRANEALDQIQSAQYGIQAAQENNAPEQIAEMRLQISEQIPKAVAHLKQALTLRDGKTPIDEVNQARYYLCYMYWEQKRYYDAAVLGEFLARRYPQHSGARSGAKIALAAYVQAYHEATSNDKEFESRRISDIAQYIVTRWPDMPEAQEAAITLVNFAISRRELDKAMELLGKIPAGSTQRSEAEIKAGLAFWAEYIKSLRLPEGDRPPQAELDKLVKQSQLLLESGIAGLRKEKADEVSPTTVAAMLSLAQINLDLSQQLKAVELLEEPKHGPLTLVRAKSPLTNREGFADEVYKTALRGYIAVERLSDAEKVMEELEQSIKDGEKLTAIYIGMAQDLQRQLDDLRQRNDARGLEAVTQAFEVFLKRIPQRAKGNTFNSLNWVAGTFYTLATGFDIGGVKLAPKAQEYYQEAAATYEKALELAKADGKAVQSPESLLGVRIRLATCKRRLRNFVDATALFSEILKEKNTLLPAQFEAALTYQARGDLENPKAYELAINGGGGKDVKNQNIIWGWGKIANLAASQYNRGDLTPEQKETWKSKFHEARYNLIQCRRKLAEKEQDEKQKQRLFEIAKRELRVTYQLYPDLGGNEWAKRYEAELKAVQKGLGQPVAGLDEFRSNKGPQAAGRKSPVSVGGQAELVHKSTH